MDKSKKPGGSASSSSKVTRAPRKKAVKAVSDAAPAIPVTELVQSAQRRYLIAPRRGKSALEAGIKPMSASEMDETLACMPGVTLVKTLKAPAASQLMSAERGEATDTYLVSMDEATAAMLQETAPPHILIEEDAPLDYGETRKVELGEMAPQAFCNATPVRQTFVLLVTSQSGTPIPEVPVTVKAEGFPVSGITDDKGQVQLSVLLQPGSSPRSLSISPTKGFWNRRIHQPQLQPGRINVVQLFGLDEPSPLGHPLTKTPWGPQLMGFGQCRIGSGRGVRVAVIDSGTDNSHPQLAHISHGYDFTDPSMPHTWHLDLIGHGSHCSGVIGARAATGAAFEQVTGLAPDAEIHSLKIFPGGSVSSLIEALDYCIDHQIDVANLSLGTEKISLSVEQKLEEAASLGVACIVATGNSGGHVLYPAASPYVLAVSALGMRSQIPPGARELEEIQPDLTNDRGLFVPRFSCYGPQVDVCAPGVGVISTVPGKGLRPDSGTSMAAPHISGLAAGLLSDAEISPLLGQRGSERVERLFELIRAICTPVFEHDPANHSGAGVPSLSNLNRLLPHR